MKRRKLESLVYDLGMTDAEETQAKADLAIRIFILMRQDKWTIKEAAEFLDTDIDKFRDCVMKGKFKGYTLERLEYFVEKLEGNL